MIWRGSREPHRSRVAILGIKGLPAFAGADRVVEQVIDHLPGDLAYTVYLMQRSGAPRVSCTSRVRYVYVPGLRGKHLAAFSYFLLCALHCLLKERPDVAHIHNSDFGLFALLLRVDRRLRIVGTFHGDPYLREKWGVGARVFLLLSEWAFERACHALTSVSPRHPVGGKRVEHIPNGLPAMIAAPSELPDELVRLDGGFVLFACGRLDKTKGLHHLLSAYRELDTELRLVAVGDFAHDAEYSAGIEHQAASDARVLLHRTLLDRAALQELLRRATLFVFPSDVEAMSMMLLEAIASGCPLVCSDIEANRLVVGDTYSHLFKAADTADLVAALREALAQADHSTAATLLARTRERYDWRSIGADYGRLYRAAPEVVIEGALARIERSP